MPEYRRTEEIIGGLRSITVEEIPTADELAEQAAVEARRDVLRATVDPTRTTPPSKDVQEAVAFLALAQDQGVKHAREIAGEIDQDGKPKQHQPKGNRP